MDVMKVDVEGAELAVLQGAERIIQREKPAIIFEANAETCEAAGYNLALIGPVGELTPVGEQARFCNVLARHPGGRSEKERDGRA